MADEAEVERIWIEAAADPTTGEPKCVVTWGGKQKVVGPDRVLATARELFGAAAAAETDLTLVEFLREANLPDQVVGAALMHAREQRGKLRMPEGPKPVFRIGAIVGVKTGLPLVSIGLGSREETLDTATAREMASHWHEVAVHAVLDVRIRYLLSGDYGLNIVEVERFMTDLFNLARTK